MKKSDIDTAPVTVGLEANVQTSIRVALEEVLPLWLSEPQVDLKRVVRPTGSGSSSINIEYYFGSQTWISFRRKLENLDSLKQLESSLRLTHPELLGYVGYSGYTLIIQNIYSLITCWCSFASKMLKQNLAIDAALNFLLKNLDKLLSTKRGIHESISTLSGLQLPEGVEKIQLEENVILRRLSFEEVSDFDSNDITLENSYNLSSSLVTTAIVVTSEVDVTLAITRPSPDLTFFAFHQVIQDKINNFIYALHTLKPGRVGVVATFNKFHPNVLPNLGAHSSTSIMLNPFGFLELTQEECNLLQILYKKINTSQRNEIRIAVARLVDAENRLSPVDSLLDAVIGLEVLLNPNDYGELAFRVALNYAHLAEESKRRERYENVRDVQKTRNRIVHGGLNLQSKDGSIIHEHAELAKSCLRDAITYFLNDETLAGKMKMDSDFWLDRIIPPNSKETK